MILDLIIVLFFFSEIDMESFVLRTFSCLFGCYGKRHDVIVV